MKTVRRKKKIYDINLSQIAPKIQTTTVMLSRYLDGRTRVPLDVAKALDKATNGLYGINFFLQLEVNNKHINFYKQNISKI